MTENKRKFTTALLTTALLSCGFSIDTETENQQEKEIHKEVCIEKEDVEHLDLVVEDDTENNLKTNSTVETTLSYTKPEHQQADSQGVENQLLSLETDSSEWETQRQGRSETDSRTTNRQKATPSTKKHRHQTESKEEEPNTGNPDIPEPLEIFQGGSNDIYELQETEVTETGNAVITVTYPSAESPVTFVPGFGWIEDSGEPNTQILALDMYESGVKVGSMGGR